MNGGVCTAPDTCDCSTAVGYTGVDCNSRKYYNVKTLILTLCLLCIGRAILYQLLIVSDSLIISPIICSPDCMNGGVCRAPDICVCTAAVGYVGVDCNSRKVHTIYHWFVKPFYS